MQDGLLSDRLSHGAFRGINPDALFVNHVLLNTRNPLQAKSSVEKVFFPHSLRTSQRGPVNFAHRSARLSSLSFNLIQYGADVEVAASEINRSHYVVVVPLSGSAEVENQNERSSLQFGRFVMLDPMARFRFEMPADHSHLAIGIPKTRLWTQVNRILPQRRAGHVTFSHGSYRVDQTCSSLFEFIGYICSELDSPYTLTGLSSVSGAMEESFLNLLLSSLLDGPDEDDRIAGGQAAPSYVRKAEEFILAHLTEEITIQDIIRTVDVPERTLHHAFSKYRGAGPIAWLRHQRLCRARLDLIQGAERGLTVTEVAHHYQIPHIGRFARAYQKEFGELPSETLRHGASGTLR